MKVNAIGEYALLGETLDDAAGEAFDKTAKLMGLPYPGGPQLAKLALQGRNGAFKFSRPMVNRPGLDFSFSGLKTQVLLAWQKSPQTEQDMADIALAFEQAVVDTLAIKCERAMLQENCRRLIVAGGVGANRYLREQLQQRVAKLGGQVYFPRMELCTDNGAMIAFAGCLRLQAGQHEPPVVSCRPRWDLAGLPPLSPAHGSNRCMDKVFIEALEIECVIGIYDWERTIRQPIVLDIEMAFDNRVPAASDSIDDTLDYKSVSKRLIQFVSESSFGLVETLAERCCEIILSEFNVSQVKLKLSKIGAVRGAKAVGVMIERTRADA
jgi:FolB domain-containing protein